MIRAVLDTNALASGIVGFLKQSSAPGGIMRAWRNGHFTLVSSDHIRSELERTLQLPYFRQRLTPERIAKAVDLVRRETMPVEITTDVRGVATHPEDDLILAAAVSADADYLVTGDKKLQGLRVYQGVTIVSPTEFLSILQSQSSV